MDWTKDLFPLRPRVACVARLFTVTVTEKERMHVEPARELISLRDG